MARRARIRISGLEFDDHSKVPASVRGEVVPWDAFVDPEARQPYYVRKQFVNDYYIKRWGRKLIDRAAYRRWAGGESRSVEFRVGERRSWIVIGIIATSMMAVAFRYFIWGGSIFPSWVTGSVIGMLIWFGILGGTACLFVGQGLAILALGLRTPSDIHSIESDIDNLTINSLAHGSVVVPWRDVVSIRRGFGFFTISTRDRDIRIPMDRSADLLVMATRAYPHINTGLCDKLKLCRGIRMLVVGGAISGVIVWGVLSWMLAQPQASPWHVVMPRSPAVNGIATTLMMWVLGFALWLEHVPIWTRRVRRRWARKRAS